MKKTIDDVLYLQKVTINREYSLKFEFPWLHRLGVT